ncbi:MAG: COG4315 family predicted lipoprotein [Acidimicrobiia bacterium]
MIKRTGIISLLAALALIGACGSGDNATTTGAAGATTTTAAETTLTAADETTTTASEATGPAIVVAASDLGDILTDSDGRTLYLFTPDAQGDSTCYDACADNWPALTGEVSAGDGVDGSLLGTTTRTDGAVQVTYNGWPLYHFAADAAPGDVNGQGLNDVWYVVDATGNAITG